MKLRAALVVLCTCVAACGESHTTTAGVAPACATAATVTITPTGAPQDFSALDPVRCPAVVPEDRRGANPRAPYVMSDSFIEEKAFYVLALLEVVADARAALSTWPALATLAAERQQALQTAVSSCNSGAPCWGQAVKWSDTDIDRAGDALVSLYDSSTAIKAAAASLRRSGEAQLHASLSDAELLRAAWLDAVHALNQGWDDHVAGLAAGTVYGLLTDVAATSSASAFFSPLLRIVLGGLEADGRDEAARYEPLAEGENAAVLARIPCIDFSKYPFAAIVVPGQGPMDLNHPLDPDGQVRADQAAARFAAGLAPLIALSGGHVHPDRTPYSEAIEMKKYLMATYAIPAAALLVDPHARHTTTNLRNVARLLYRYGVPVDRPSLITTDQFQTAYIAAAGPMQVFGKRCLDELGYFPYRGLSKLDLVDDCWVPSVDSLYADARDLLDP